VDTGLIESLPMTETKRQAVKIPIEAYELLRELAAHAARHGWSAFGVDRDDPPTQTALLEEGIRMLDKARRAKRRKR
jgi:hypothetical protein